MKLPSIKSTQPLIYFTHCDVIKVKKQSQIFIHGEHFNQEKSLIFRQFACAAGKILSLMLAQKCKIGISEFWAKSNKYNSSYIFTRYT